MFREGQKEKTNGAIKNTNYPLLMYGFNVL